MSDKVKYLIKGREGERNQSLSLYQTGRPYQTHSNQFEEFKMWSLFPPLSSLALPGGYDAIAVIKSR
jgi:hypothetical protein